MGLSDLLRNNMETSENHRISSLRSHYYKTNYRQAKDLVLGVVRKNNWKVSSQNDTYKEIYIQEKNFHIIITFVQVGAFLLAIDVKVNAYGLIGLNKPRKMIEGFYKQLDKALEFKGISMSSR